MSDALTSRDGTVTIGDLIDAYMAAYCGRDSSRTSRLSWWKAKLGTRSLTDISHAARPVLRGLGRRRQEHHEGEGQAARGRNDQPLPGCAVCGADVGTAETHRAEDVIER